MAKNREAHTFFFADLAGFTAMTEAMGDESAVAVAADFYAELEAIAPDFRAVAVKRIGDAVMIRASEAGGAMRFAVRIVGEIGDRHLFPAVRVGMHTGHAIERNGDWFGAAVNLAARVSAEASGREVLLTAATRDAAGEVAGVELHERGRRTLRDVAEPVTLYAALREGERSVDALPIDPVCRMAVDPAHSAGRLVHDGAEYNFCSLDCVGRFAAAPGRYTRPAEGQRHDQAGPGR